MKPPPDPRHHRRRGGHRRWQEHNTERQHAILAAAVDLIEEQDAGQEVSVREIAERAGVARSVVYRQFENRDDLDARIRAFILRRSVAEFESGLVLDPGKSADDVILTVMRSVVRWAREHPRLYRFGQSGPVHGHDGAETSLSIARNRIAEILWQRFSSWAAVLGIEVESFRPLVYGVVGLVQGVVTHGVDNPDDPAFADPEAIARLLTSSVWHLFAGHAADLGYRFDRTDNLAAVLGELFADAARTPAAMPGQRQRPTDESARPVAEPD
ncbi:TetR/AcrR family transcriptional regulator [Nocardia otitidiscaviarum]|uniref:TetR/AcrR family transcriptional regulator n=1 Tax=Nocardia otitidiscaviarum TaxID=1823 RepID=UPI001893A6A2|nr:TetR/AcrR family transcriptional regulator [Nocardia otitidiscaviarum]MBF6237225.1 TetR/AcrR family transcriptional regulator [Nocardia otitidiscaviarum]